VTEPLLRADPDRPADPGWREPAWFPPRERERRPSPAAVVFGLALIAIGVWFFLDRTIGVDLPRIQWGTIWPVILIALGGLILLRSFRRRA
jgi:lipopolysaccharide export LptBFGC system permease protein LptF